MHFKTFTSAFTAALLATTAHASGWASFCDELFCSENCGIGVSVNNPGCLAQAGRRSVMLTGLNWQSVALLWSPNGDTECTCQTHCESGLFLPNLQKDRCMSMDFGPWANSFHFVNGDSCPDETCPEKACWNEEECAAKS